MEAAIRPHLSPAIDIALEVALGLCQAGRSG
jgi:hypothetical protein